VLDLARQYRPRLISLDLSLPDVHGWTVLSQLKRDSALRHIPVQVCGAEHDRIAARRRGARTGLTKPIADTRVRADLDVVLGLARRSRGRLLVVQGPGTGDDVLVNAVGGPDLDTMVASTADQALALLGRQAFDCVLVDVPPQSTSWLDLLGRAQPVKALHDTPFVVYQPAHTGETLSRAEDFTRTMVVSIVPTVARALDETALFLHRPADRLSRAQREMLVQAGNHDVLAGRKILVVDDDTRNILALSSLLESNSVQVVSSSSGVEAIRLIDEVEDLSLVLLDIMMPAMDGYETLRRMRTNQRFRRPIIALTAKAMAGDREKCLEAGASDYIAKPVDSEALLALLRVWLHR
jgi:CheY-like chemotaxis protein